MKKFFTLLCLFYVYLLNGQSENFDYKKWTYPNVKIPYLSINTSYKGNFGKFSQEPNIKDNSNSGNERLNFEFGAFQNDTLWQKSNTHSLDINYSSINKNTDSNTKYKVSFGTQRNYRYYYDKEHSKDRSQNRYVEWGIDAQLYKEEQLNYKFYGGTMFLPIKVGFGRMEPMNDVFLAQFLADDLQSNQLIDSSFSNADIFELAKVMAQVRQHRIFDSRRAYIYQMNAISKWLFEHNVPNDLRTYNIVNDNWMNVNPFNRKLGYRASLGIVPFVRHEYWNSSSQKYGGIDLMAEFVYSKPISQFWHVNVNVFANSILYGMQYNGKNMLILTKGRIEFDYIPTSRTSHSFSSGFNLLKPTPIDNNIYFYLGYNSSIFVTNKVRIRAYCDINYRQLSKLEDSTTNFYFLNTYSDSFFEKNYFSSDTFNEESKNISINWSISMNYILF